MKNLKKSSKMLYTVCAFIMTLMVAGYFGSKNLKGTYSVTQTCSSFGVPSGKCGDEVIKTTNGAFSCSGYTYIKEVQSNKCIISGEEGGEYTWYIFRKKGTYNKYPYCDVYGVPSGKCGDEIIKTTNGSLYCNGYTYSKTVQDEKCTISGEEGGEYFWYIYKKEGTVEASCYVANNKYQWFTSPSTDNTWKKVDRPENLCSGCVAGYSKDSNGNCSPTVTIVFKNGSTVVKTQSCTIPSGSQTCTTDIIAPGPQTSSDSNKVFNGWGETETCTSGSYTANAALRPASSRTYYACYRDASDDDTPSKDFSTSKCTYSSLYTVTRDTRYLNCKYTNITYNNSATEDTVGNVKACCSARGYKWIAENFTSSGYGNEYCIVCGGNTGGGGSNPSSSSSSTPSSSSSTPSTTPSSVPSSSSNIEDNPKTGSVAIFIVWIIALGTLVYAGVYFKQVREDN